ncbi:unnamed protein product [Polarella glacialis]|uniref:Uncharacterized protein n=1 Tax=Polarella glacialis TaxID=89957 RepID=A0A813J288_POLGL|nr:unnamed protein product [Polarella glacialis]
MENGMCSSSNKTPPRQSGSSAIGKRTPQWRTEMLPSRRVVNHAQLTRSFMKQASPTYQGDNNEVKLSPVSFITSYRLQGRKQFQSSLTDGKFAQLCRVNDGNPQVIQTKGDVHPSYQSLWGPF